MADGGMDRRVKGERNEWRKGRWRRGMLRVIRQHLLKQRDHWKPVFAVLDFLFFFLLNLIGIITCACFF